MDAEDMVDLRVLLFAGCVALAGCTQAIEEAEVIFKGADPTRGPDEQPAPQIATPPPPLAVIETAELPPLQDPESARQAPPLAATETGGAVDDYVQYEPARYHTVQPGETVYSIARAYDTTPSAIRLTNSLDDRFSIQPGQVLTVPTGKAPPPPSAWDPLPAGPVQARQLASPQLNQYRSDAVARRLLRPVPGDIVAAFGEPAAGAPRTGIELRALPGIPVKAADDGEVMFVSSDDSPLGQMLLMKHSDGLMSVYGNLRNVSVRKGAVLGRGAILAEVAEPPRGRVPTVRFELRQGATPIDPTPYL